MEKMGNIFIIIIATILMQYHGILFWTSIVGNTGIAWSIALEASALWLWFYSQQNRILAVVASLLLLAGPLYHIASPVFETTHQQALAENSRTSGVEILKQDIATAEASLTNALENSKTRAGWLNEIQESKNAISEKRLQLVRLVQQETPPQYIRQWLVTAIQAATLLVVWLVSVYAIRALANSVQNKMQIEIKPVLKTAVAKTISSTPRAETKKQIVDKQANLEIRVVEALKLELQQKKLSQANWAKLVGISRNNVSLIMNHKQRLANKKETAPRKQFVKAAIALGIISTEQEANAEASQS